MNPLFANCADRTPLSHAHRPLEVLYFAYSASGTVLASLTNSFFSSAVAATGSTMIHFCTKCFDGEKQTKSGPPPFHMDEPYLCSTMIPCFAKCADGSICGRNPPFSVCIVHADGSFCGRDLHFSVRTVFCSVCIVVKARCSSIGE